MKDTIATVKCQYVIVHLVRGVLTVMDINFACLVREMFSLTAILVNVLVAAMGAPDEYDGALSYALVVLNVVVITIIAGEVVVGLFIRLKHLRIHKAISQCCFLMKVMAVNAYRRMTNSLSHDNGVYKDESSNSFTE
ncbi:hypothetical protein HOLleu_02225 [Holothuria leucospilota]|uniref:Uncharacterized protein n=1 Tax=Holothuria leucospilota TaxID=206669 RepID=A0A9Q1CRX0_HOLLE|nr:hypothetical protein HOLleu_02225 [Holothuria leucospilota]